MSDEGYYTLARAIILQAVKDFKPTYLRLKRRPDDMKMLEDSVTDTQL